MEAISVLKLYGNLNLVNIFNHLDDFDVTQFPERLSSVSPNDISKESIELMISECSSLLFNAADAAGMITHKIPKESTRESQLNHKRVKRLWFDAFLPKASFTI